MDYLKYTLWPAVKVKLTYWWWVIKYGGKKNIPPELIFSKISGSMERMRDSLGQALRHLPPDASEKEKKELLDLLRVSGELEEEFEKSKYEKQKRS